MSDQPQAGREGPTRCGFVALVGAPNAGKSTLLNSLVGERVSIVTHKVQTTRFRIRGIALEGASQLIFVDTPGIFEPKRKLDTAMVQAAWEGAGDADAVALVVDAPAQARVAQARESGADKRASPASERAVVETDTILERLQTWEKPKILVLNKVDQLEPPALLAMTAALNERLTFEGTFMVSALSGDGVPDLLAHLAHLMPESPWLYPADQAADLPLRLLAAEVTREKALSLLHEEVPYQLTVETEKWTERKDGSVRIDQLIFVARDNQKAIVLGKGGRMLKDIGAKARADLSEAMGRPVHLFIHVKVRERWQEDPERYQAMGLDFPRS